MKSLIIKNLFLIFQSIFQKLLGNVFYKALRKKDIRINNIKVSENLILHTGDEVKIYILDNYLYPSELPPEIIYEDNNILIVNKPKDIVVVGENSLTLLLSKFGYKVFPCHRLDRNTKGLVLFAKSETVLNILLEKFKANEITKYYKCKVFGTMDKKSEILNAYLFKDSKKSLVYISENPEKGYKKIITEYRVIEENLENNTSMLEVILHTGRTHQIRAHLAHIGHPIIGDRKIWK